MPKKETRGRKPSVEFTTKISIAQHFCKFREKSPNATSTDFMCTARGTYGKTRVRNSVCGFESGRGCRMLASFTLLERHCIENQRVRPTDLNPKDTVRKMLRENGSLISAVDYLYRTIGMRKTEARNLVDQIVVDMDLQ